MKKENYIGIELAQKLKEAGCELYKDTQIFLAQPSPEDNTWSAGEYKGTRE